MENFSKIEKSLNVSIFIYQIDKSGNNYKVGIIRKGSLFNIDENRHIYLCQIFSEPHMCLILDFQKFMYNLRSSYGGFSMFMEINRFCQHCLNFVKVKKLKNHLTQCFNFRGLSNITLPRDGEKYKFRGHRALEKTPFVCFYDIEASVCKTDVEVCGATHEHKILSYAYIIVDKAGIIRIQRIETKKEGVSNLSSNMIRSMLEDFTDLMEEEMRTWDKFPKLSYDDELQYKGAKTCEICCVQFSKAKPANKHHQWSSFKMKWSKQCGWEESM